jgi:hypothetical protein
MITGEERRKVMRYHLAKESKPIINDPNPWITDLPIDDPCADELSIFWGPVSTRHPVIGYER